MDEIRFNAWDSRTNTMHLWEDDPHNIAEWIGDCPEYITLLQYTGLKDKNGKEIFKDSLVKKENRTIGAVLWHEGSISFRCKYDRDKETIYTMLGYDCEWRAEDYEVIGDIYQNPELFK